MSSDDTKKNDETKNTTTTTATSTAPMSSFASTIMSSIPSSIKSIIPGGTDLSKSIESLSMSNLRVPTTKELFTLPSIPKLSSEEIETSLQKIGTGIAIGTFIGLLLFRKSTPNRTGWWITSACTGFGISIGNIYTRTSASNTSISATSTTTTTTSNSK